MRCLCAKAPAAVRPKRQNDVLSQPLSILRAVNDRHDYDLIMIVVDFVDDDIWPFEEFTSALDKTGAAPYASAPVS